MKVWDGVSWVSHSGTVCRGEQVVVEYGGLTATPDHEVCMHEYIQALKLYAVFDGRATSREYWRFILLNSLIWLAL